MMYCISTSIVSSIHGCMRFCWNICWLKYLKILAYEDRSLVAEAARSSCAEHLTTLESQFARERPFWLSLYERNWDSDMKRIVGQKRYSFCMMIISRYLNIWCFSKCLSMDSVETVIWRNAFWLDPCFNRVWTADTCILPQVFGHGQRCSDFTLVRVHSVWVCTGSTRPFVHL